jgi:hypothetical protein
MIANHRYICNPPFAADMVPREAAPATALVDVGLWQDRIDFAFVWTMGSPVE